MYMAGNIFKRVMCAKTAVETVMNSTHVDYKELKTPYYIILVVLLVLVTPKKLNQYHKFRLVATAYSYCDNIVHKLHHGESTSTCEALVKHL